MTLPYILRHSSFAFTVCTAVVFTLFTLALCVGACVCLGGSVDCRVVFLPE